MNANEIVNWLRAEHAYRTSIPFISSGWNGLAEAAALVETLKAQNERLAKELQFLMDCLDEGSLVRNISKDSDPNWHLKMVILVTHLQEAKAVLEKKL